MLALILISLVRALIHLTSAKPQAGAKEPVGIPSNVTFGIGDERNVLYITVDKSLYRIRLNARGLKQPYEK